MYITHVFKWLFTKRMYKKELHTMTMYINTYIFFIIQWLEIYKYDYIPTFINNSFCIVENIRIGIKLQQKEDLFFFSDIVPYFFGADSFLQMCQIESK